MRDLAGLAGLEVEGGPFDREAEGWDGMGGYGLSCGGWSGMYG